MAGKSAGTGKADSDLHRLTVRMMEADYQRLEYWANKKDASVNEFIIDMLDLYIKVQNGDYDYPTMEVARLNQLVDIVQGMSQNMQSLESIVISGFDSLLSLTRGDNFLLDEEDGEV